MNRNAAAVVVAACAAAGGGAIVVIGACIPDLPSDPASVGPICGDGIIDLDAEACDPGPRAGDAGVAGCNANCQIQCPQGRQPSPINHHCYERLSVARTLQGARQQCGRSEGGAATHVVTFASEEEFQQVLPLLDVSGSRGAFWVGLETTPAGRYTSVVPAFEPGWSPSCSGCYAHTGTPEAALPLFADASVEGGPDDCVAAVSDPQQPWQQYPCAGLGYNVIDVICELEPIGRQSRPCEAGICVDLVKTYPSKRYVYKDTLVTADQARQTCIGLGGQLVILQSRDEREQLWYEVSRLTPPPLAVWIGLTQVAAGTRRRVPASWAWDDTTPADGPDAYPSEWGDLQPNSNGAPATLTTRAFLWHQEFSAAIDETLARNDQPSTSSFPFVCEITAETLAASRDAGGDH